MATSKPFVSPSFTYETLEETLDVKPKGVELFIGIPRETSFQENRIALKPEAVSVLFRNGHRVLMESKAGKGSSYADKDEGGVDDKVCKSKKEIWKGEIQ